MKFRIIVGSFALESQTKVDQIMTLYQSPQFIIQGSKEIQTIDLNDGRQVFIAGKIIGIRNSEGEIIPCPSDLTSLKEFFQTDSTENCRENLEGRFLIAIAGPRDSCIIYTDRYGMFDLYYQTIDNTKTFASDLSLFHISLTKYGFDQEGLAHSYTVYGYRPPKRHTLYRNVHRLGVGEYVCIDQGHVDVTERPFKPKLVAQYSERELNKYTDTLLDAILLRGSRDGNVVSLSSGWDSTSILACLVHIFGASKVRAVTGRMIYADRSGVINQYEIDRAQAIADYFNIRLDIVDLDYRKSGPHLVERYLSLLKSHFIHSISTISQAILYDHVARTINGDEKLFVGEISDGAHNLGFSQFATIFHPVLSFREYSDKMASYLFGPTFLKLFQNGQFVNDPIYAFMRGQAHDAIFDEPGVDDPTQRTQQLLASFFLRGKRIPLWSLRNSKMLTQIGILKYSTEMESTYLRNPAETINPETLYAWYLHLYNSFHWQSSMIASRFLIAEAHGLIMALPFWDSRIQNFLSAMPEDWGRGLDLNPTKYPLKWMLKNRIKYPMHLQVGPHSYQSDVNPLFSHSGEIIYGSAFCAYFKGLLRSRPYHAVLDSEMFDINYIDSIVCRFLEGTEVRGAELNDLMSICMLQMVGLYE